MKAFFQECLKMGWKPNPQTNPQHEQQVKDLLDKHNLKYEYQPNGSQNSPDFRVLYNGKVIDIECKSSATTTAPTYNSGLPKKGVVYIFSAKKYNSTTFFFAEDVVSEGKRKLYDDLLVDLTKVVQSYQNMIEWKDERGFDFYMRAMYTQSGGAVYKDYFTHKRRKECEDRVLNYSW